MSIMLVAALVLGGGWILGEFLLAPYHCGGSVCEGWSRQLRLSMVSSFAGMGCLRLAAANTLPRLFLPLGTGLLALTALAGLANVGMFIVTGVDFLLVVGVIGWLLVTWRER